MLRTTSWRSMGKRRVISHWVAHAAGSAQQSNTPWAGHRSSSRLPSPPPPLLDSPPGPRPHRAMSSDTKRRGMQAVLLTGLCYCASAGCWLLAGCGRLSFLPPGPGPRAPVPTCGHVTVKFVDLPPSLPLPRSVPLHLPLPYPCPPLLFRAREVPESVWSYGGGKG